MEKEGRQRNTLLFVFCILLFMAIAFYTTKILNPRSYDFAAYWQAAYMLGQGGDIYNAIEWLSVREIEQTALHSEMTFQAAKRCSNYINLPDTSQPSS
jgi:hypothetical protein